jgi:hypothetical protein
VFFQRNPVGGSDHALGRQDARSWAASNSFGADKFGNRLTIALRHDLIPLCTDCAVIVEFAACQSLLRSAGRWRL